MEPEKKTELKKFLMPTMVGVYFGLVLVVIGVVGSFFAPYPGAPLAIFLLLAVVFSVKPLWQLWEMNGFLSEAEKEGVLPDVYEDYQQGEKLMGGKVRIGQRYVMGKGGVVPTRFEEIEQVYEYIHKTNGAEDAHRLTIRLKNDDKRILCLMTPMRRDPQGVLSVFAAIKQRNPDVKIGA